jgi:hypothetical protein
MTETRSHLIRQSAGVTRVLRLVCADGRAWPLAYEVHPDEDMCRLCGCTEIFGCPDGCAWANASHTICTRCLEKELLP